MDRPNAAAAWRGMLLLHTTRIGDRDDGKAFAQRELAGDDRVSQPGHGGDARSLRAAPSQEDVR